MQKLIRSFRFQAAFALLFAAIAFAPESRAQFIFNLDTGVQDTKYGSESVQTYPGTNQVNPNTLTYTQGPLNKGFADMGLGFIFAGHSKRKYGFNVYALGDFTVPFSTDPDTGGVFSGGGVVGANLRYRQVAVGTGIDFHEYSFTSDGTASTTKVEYPQRPNELLLAVPILAKYNFGPAGRAYVQGGYSFIVGNVAGKYSDGHNLQSSVTLGPGELSLLSGKQSGETKIGGGYSFGHLTARVSYIHRDVYFDHSLSTTIKSTTPATYFDFHQDITSVGIVLTAF